MPASMLQRIALLLVTAALLAGAAQGESVDAPALAESLDALIEGHPTADRTTVALKVVDLETGDVLYDRGGDKLFVPASNLKIYTAACALDVLGPGRRFPTRLMATGPVRDGTLRGDLALVGGGNAMLSSEDLARLAERVVNEWGVRRVIGRVVVDNRRYAPVLKGPGWMWDDEPDYYNMSVTPLMVDFNVLTVRISPGPDGTTTATLAPPTPYPSIREMPVRAGDENKQRVTRRPFTETILFWDRGPVKEVIEQRLTMNAPGPWAAAVFERMLTDRGVRFTPAPSTSDSANAPHDATAKIVDDGPPLTEAIKHFLKVSENAVGEVILHEIAIEQGVDRPSWSPGAKAITEWLESTAGLEPGSFRLVDGSGLSRYNLISADSSVKLLAFMHGHEHFQAFFDGLPRYQIDEEDDPDAQITAAPNDAEPVAAKPGGMTGVSTISGYLRTRGGRLLAFSLLANGYTGSNAPVIDLRKRVWRELATYEPSVVLQH